MKKLFALLVATVLLAGLPALADTFVTVPNPQAVFNSTLGRLSSVCPPGQAGACTKLPTMNANGGVAIGTTGAPPTNGLVVLGNVGIGTTSATSQFVLVGLGTTAPIGTSATGTLCIDSQNNVYRKATCP